MQLAKVLVSTEEQHARSWAVSPKNFNHAFLSASSAFQAPQTRRAWGLGFAPPREMAVSHRGSIASAEYGARAPFWSSDDRQRSERMNERLLIVDDETNVSLCFRMTP